MALNYNLVIILLLFCISICNADQSADPLGEFCNENAKINDTQLPKNIDNLLAKLVATTVQDGFSTTSTGNEEHKVYGLAQCRGDVSRNDCASCIQDAAKEIRKRCPDVADARIWYDYCFLRYDTRKFFGQVDSSYGIIYYNVDNVTDADDFNKRLGSLIAQVRKQALTPGNKGLGKGKTKLSAAMTLYALAQCTRDLSELYCAQCLAIAVGNFATICSDRKGCRTLYSSCYVRYELYPFFFPLDPQEILGNASAKYYSSLVSKP